MKRPYDRVYQFKIALKGVEPPVWRRIQVPETCSFWDFHVAIQDGMGWLDCHLHEFELADPSTGKQVSIGIPNDDFIRTRSFFPDGSKRYPIISLTGMHRQIMNTISETAGFMN